MILFTADWHIKLGQKNVPVPWACTRYKLFFQQVEEAIEKHDCLPFKGVTNFECLLF